MSQDTISIAVVGGGRTGTPLIENLLEIPYIRLAGIADRDPHSEGAMLARKYDIFFTEDADVLAAKGNEIDIIIEVSGDPHVKPKLREAFQAQGNRHTILLPDLVARLILSMATGSNTLKETYHPEDKGIG